MEKKPENEMRAIALSRYLILIPGLYMLHFTHTSVVLSHSVRVSPVFVWDCLSSHLTTKYTGAEKSFNVM